MIEQLIIPKPQAAQEFLKLNPFSNSESVYFHRISGTLARIGTRYSLIDLFGGAGGLTLGFTKHLGHTFQPVWANDFNLESVETYVKNFDGHIVLGDINEVLDDPAVHLPDVDVVIGGPPCQGFSLLNKNRNGDSPSVSKVYAKAVPTSRRNRNPFKSSIIVDRDCSPFGSRAEQKRRR